MRKTAITVLLIYPVLFILTLLFNFSYGNFLDTFDLYYNLEFIEIFHSISALYFAFFVPVVIGEYYFYKKQGQEFSKKLFFFFPLRIVAIGIILFEITELISFSFILCSDGFCIFNLVIVPFYIFVVLGAWGLIRTAFSFDSSKIKSSPIIKFIENSSSNISKKIIFLLIMLMLLSTMIIAFDFITDGRYFGISNQSNEEHWASESIEKDDVSLCKYSENVYHDSSALTDLESCYADFFKEKSNEINIANYYDAFDHLNKSYCNNKDIDPLICSEAILWSLQDVLKQNIYRNIKDGPKIIYGIDLNYAVGGIINNTGFPNKVGIIINIPNSAVADKKIKQIKTQLLAKNLVINSFKANEYRDILREGYYRTDPEIIYLFSKTHDDESGFLRSLGIQNANIATSNFKIIFIPENMLGNIFIIADSKEFLHNSSLFYQIYNEVIYPNVYNR